MLKRREFMTFLGGAASSSSLFPLPLLAQQATPLIGFINNGSARAYAPFVDAFRQGLRQTGYVEGRSVAIQYRWGEGQSARIPGFIAELVRLPATVIVTGGSDVAAREAKAATGDHSHCGDDRQRSGRDGPREQRQSARRKRYGYQRVCRPISGKAAGACARAPDKCRPRRLPGQSGQSKFQDRRQGNGGRSEGLGQQFVVLRLDRTECDAAVASLVQQGAKALIVESDPFFNSMVERLVALARRHAIPAVFPRREFATAGGLMSYGSSLSEVPPARHLYGPGPQGRQAGGLAVCVAEPLRAGRQSPRPPRHSA